MHVVQDVCSHRCIAMARGRDKQHAAAHDSISAAAHAHPLFVPPLHPSQVRPLEMPGLGSVSGFSGSHKHTEIFFTFTGFTEPVGGPAGWAWWGRAWEPGVLDARGGSLVWRALPPHRPGHREGGLTCLTPPSPLAATPQGATYRADLADADPQPRLFRRTQTAGFSPDDFVTKQVRPSWGAGWTAFAWPHAGPFSATLGQTATQHARHVPSSLAARSL